ncbi:ribonuclease domain-containing protein [Dyella sp.]|uniref:ribonuclease domain-containing protein n=1 Tax=Dyella sp. TaxID=1869338 RepID=UPI002ED46036
MRIHRILPLIILAALIGWMFMRPQAPTQLAADRQDRPTATSGSGGCPILPRFLPQEAFQTIKLIENEGPFPHRQDGVVFGNREGLLPPQANGYYHEYTVQTPGSQDRGARRIITGGTPPSIYYYTEDHYRSFRCFRVHP